MDPDGPIAEKMKKLGDVAKSTGQRAAKAGGVNLAEETPDVSVSGVEHMQEDDGEMPDVRAGRPKAGAAPIDPPRDETLEPECNERPVFIVDAADRKLVKDECLERRMDRRSLFRSIFAKLSRLFFSRFLSRFR